MGSRSKGQAASASCVQELDALSWGRDGPRPWALFPARPAHTHTHTRAHVHLPFLDYHMIAKEDLSMDFWSLRGRGEKASGAHLNPHQSVKVLVAKSCPSLCDLMDCSLPDSSIHGILQTRILEWIAMTSSRRSSSPRDWTQVSCVSRRFFTLWAAREALNPHSGPIFQGCLLVLSTLEGLDTLWGPANCIKDVPSPSWLFSEMTLEKGEQIKTHYMQRAESAF